MSLQLRERENYLLPQENLIKVLKARIRQISPAKRVFVCYTNKNYVGVVVAQDEHEVRQRYNRDFRDQFGQSTITNLEIQEIDITISEHYDVGYSYGQAYA